MVDFSAKVSIVIPVYNGADYLDDAIRSALSQTYPNIEVIVINDGSNDGEASERIALSYGKRLRYFSKPNGGVASALNLAINEMSGDYFSWLSHDDLYRQDKIEREIELISMLPESERAGGIVYSDFAVFSNDPNQGIQVRMKKVPQEYFRRWLTEKSVLHGCTLLVPRAAFDKCGSFDENLRTSQDYDMWFRMAEHYRFYHVSLPLVMARSHAGQGSFRMASTALTEGNALLLRFVTLLKPEELGVVDERYSRAVAYAEIAESMWYRGFGRAAYATAKFALQNFAKLDVKNVFVVLFILVRGGVKYYVLKMVRFILPPRIRLMFSRLACRSVGGA